MADGRRIGLELFRRGLWEVLGVLCGDDGGQPGVAVVESGEEFAFGWISGGVGHGYRAVAELIVFGVSVWRAGVVEHGQQHTGVCVQVREGPGGVVDDGAGLLGHARLGNVVDGLADELVGHGEVVQDDADQVVGVAVVHCKRYGGYASENRAFL